MPSKYALIERERRFLLRVDVELIKELPFKTIADHYLQNSSLRLRRVTGQSGSIYKLTQKGPANTLGKSEITTIYLNETEYEVFNKHESVWVEKTRYIKEFNDLIIGIDRYLNNADELWVAEVEFDNDGQMQQFEMPLHYIREVTADPDFNGFQLAKGFGKNIG
ncbi:hypothetical protein BH09BAC6_BH09BAC6_22870 [soil metagenome]|jgi:CYTH domain-containing protein